MLQKRLLKMLFLFIITCSSSFLFANTSKIQEIKQRGYLIVGMTATDNYPFYYMDSNDTLNGLDVNIANRIAETLNVKLRINRDAQSFNDLIPLIENQDIDLASSKLSRSLSRAQRVLYTDPYIIFRQAVLMNRVSLAKIGVHSNNLQTFLVNFNGTIGVIKGSSYERYASINFPFGEIVSFDTWNQAIQSVIEGKVFMIYRDELEIFKIFQDEPSYNLILNPVILKDRIDSIAIATELSAHHFVFFLNRVLEEMDIPTNSKELLNRYK